MQSLLQLGPRPGVSPSRETPGQRGLLIGAKLQALPSRLPEAGGWWWEGNGMREAPHALAAAGVPSWAPAPGRQGERCLDFTRSFEAQGTTKGMTRVQSCNEEGTKKIAIPSRSRCYCLG